LSGTSCDTYTSQFNSFFEQRSPVDLTVIGKIPSYAAGVLYRTGPSAYKIDTAKGVPFAMSHWFDGWSKVHRFNIIPDGANSSKVTYNSRGNVDKLIESIKKTGTLKGFSFAQKKDPCQSLFAKVMSTFEAAATPKRSSDPSEANIGVTLSVNMPGLSSPDASSPANRHASGIQTLWAKTDASRFKQLDPETLEPVGIALQASLHPSLTGPLSAAHAKSDPKTGDIYNFNLDFGRHPTYRVFHTSASTGKTDILATFSGKPAYLHSLFLSQDHVILCVWNSHIKTGGASILYNQNILDSISHFDASQPAIWYVIDRRHGNGLVATYESPAFYCFHTINAWAEQSPSDASKTDIVCELTAYANLDVLHKFYYENLLSTAPGNKQFQGPKGQEARGFFRRYRLSNVPSTPIKSRCTAVIEYTASNDCSPELPTMNPKFVTQPHRYTYGIVDRGLSSMADGLVKWDSETQSSTYWDTFAHTPGEPIFVPKPNGTEEDDGVLLSVVLDGIKETSYLLCLDAKTMNELGRAEVGGVVGFGFHGLHIKAGASGAVDF
jgi:torulene dioxygenase